MGQSCVKVEAEDEKTQIPSLSDDERLPSGPLFSAPSSTTVSPKCEQQQQNASKPDASEQSLHQQQQQVEEWNLKIGVDCAPQEATTTTPTAAQDQRQRRPSALALGSSGEEEDHLPLPGSSMTDLIAGSATKRNQNVDGRALPQRTMSFRENNSSCNNKGKKTVASDLPIMQFPNMLVTSIEPSEHSRTWNPALGPPSGSSSTNPTNAVVNPSMLNPLSVQSFSNITAVGGGVNSEVGGGGGTTANNTASHSHSLMPLSQTCPPHSMATSTKSEEGAGMLGGQQPTQSRDTHFVAARGTMSSEVGPGPLGSTLAGLEEVDDLFVRSDNPDDNEDGADEAHGRDANPHQKQPKHPKRRTSNATDAEHHQPSPLKTKKRVVKKGGKRPSLTSPSQQALLDSSNNNNNNNNNTNNNIGTAGTTTMVIDQERAFRSPLTDPVGALPPSSAAQPPAGLRVMDPTGFHSVMDEFCPQNKLQFAPLEEREEHSPAPSSSYFLQDPIFSPRGEPQHITSHLHLEDCRVDSGNVRPLPKFAQPTAAPATRDPPPPARSPLVIAASPNTVHASPAPNSGPMQPRRGGGAANGNQFRSSASPSPRTRVSVSGSAGARAPTPTDNSSNDFGPCVDSMNSSTFGSPRPSAGAGHRQSGLVAGSPQVSQQAPPPPQQGHQVLRFSVPRGGGAVAGRGGRVHNPLMQSESSDSTLSHNTSHVHSTTTSGAFSDVLPMQDSWLLPADRQHMLELQQLQDEQEAGDELRRQQSAVVGSPSYSLFQSPRGGGSGAGPLPQHRRSYPSEGPHGNSIASLQRGGGGLPRNVISDLQTPVHFGTIHTGTGFFFAHAEADDGGDRTPHSATTIASAVSVFSPRLGGDYGSSPQPQRPARDRVAPLEPIGSIPTTSLPFAAFDITAGSTTTPAGLAGGVPFFDALETPKLRLPRSDSITGGRSLNNGVMSPNRRSPDFASAPTGTDGNREGRGDEEEAATRGGGGGPGIENSPVVPSDVGGDEGKRASRGDDMEGSPVGGSLSQQPPPPSSAVMSGLWKVSGFTDRGSDLSREDTAGSLFAGSDLSLERGSQQGGGGSAQFSQHYSHTPQQQQQSHAGSCRSGGSRAHHTQDSSFTRSLNSNASSDATFRRSLGGAAGAAGRPPVAPLPPTTTGPSTAPSRPRTNLEVSALNAREGVASTSLSPKSNTGGGGGAFLQSVAGSNAGVGLVQQSFGEENVSFQIAIKQ